MPKRIQRRRTKGWRMPPGAKYVGRPTKWGNPFKVGSQVAAAGQHLGEIADNRMAVWAYRKMVTDHPEFEIFKRRAQIELGGKDLACWCPLDQPCHADVLLEIANAE